VQFSAYNGTKYGNVQQWCNAENNRLLDQAGKSTYLRQVILLTILGHIGSYVPAEFASFRIVDRLFSRIGTCDSIETNSSSFMIEMKDMSFIMQNATDRSLIIIDELGRGTSHMDGASIAFAMSEELLMKKSYIRFVTNFKELLDLEDLYPNVKAYHFTVSEKMGVGACLNFVLEEGTTTMQNYGIHIY